MSLRCLWASAISFCWSAASCCVRRRSPLVEVVTAAFECGGYSFTAKGKQFPRAGGHPEVFRSSLKEKPEDEAAGVLPALTEGQVFEPVTASVTEHFTSPPRPYTEDFLLAAMENAGKEDIGGRRTAAWAPRRQGRPSLKSWCPAGSWSARAET